MNLIKCGTCICVYVAFAAGSTCDAADLQSPAPGQAQESKSPSTATNTGGTGAEKSDAFSAAKSADDYTGKRLAYPVEVMATRKKDGKTVCVPALARLRGMSKITSDGLLVTPRVDSFNLPGKSKPGAKCSGGEGEVPFQEQYGQALIINKSTVDSIPANVSGLSYGLLVVPFKYHITGSKEFNGSGSVGPYAGYKTESGQWGASLELVGFGGLTSVAVDRTVDGKATTSNIAGFSYGFGVIGRIRENFQLGVVVGADRVGKSENYVDNGKIWIALSVGYAFSN